MTKQRDLKRLVRERQSRTGESYVTALRHVRGERGSPFPVVEMVDLSEVADALGFKCRALVLHDLAERIDVVAALRQLRTVLLTTTRDPAFDLMRAVVLCGERPFSSPPTMVDALKFLERTRAGIGGVCPSGTTVAFSVSSRAGTEMVVFLLWLMPIRFIDVPPALMLMSVNHSLGDPEHGWGVLPFGYFRGGRPP
jgi:hypothetical protein